MLDKELEDKKYNNEEEKDSKRDNSFAKPDSLVFRAKYAQDRRKKRKAREEEV